MKDLRRVGNFHDPNNCNHYILHMKAIVTTLPEFGISDSRFPDFGARCFDI